MWKVDIVSIMGYFLPAIDELDLAMAEDTGHN
jgi:hypothetical protein